MKEATVLNSTFSADIGSLPLEDFSRFKEKVIMINTLEGLVTDTDKATLKAIVRETGADLTAKTLKHALEMIVEQAIRRVTT